MPHFFIKSTEINGDTIIISDKDNYNHIARSLRAKEGEKLFLVDENKIRYETLIEKIDKKSITAKVYATYKSNRALDFELYLAQAPLRSDAQTLLMEKACELGVCGVYPILSDNCAVSKSIIEKKIPKWQKTMYEASKQCERADIPKCYSASLLTDLIYSNKFTHIIAFCERIAVETLKSYISKNTDLYNNQSKVLVIVGPEGGFSDNEFKLFQENNIPMLTLGDLILKAETAVIVGLGNIIYEYINSRKN